MSSVSLFIRLVILVYVRDRSLCWESISSILLYVLF